MQVLPVQGIFIACSSYKRCKNLQLRIYAHTYLQHNYSWLCFTLQISIKCILLNCLSHQHTIYVRTIYRYTIASIMCIYNISGQAHVCGALTKLNILSTSFWPLLSCLTYGTAHGLMSYSRVWIHGTRMPHMSEPIARV